MTPGHRRFRRGWWRIVPLVLGVLLFLVAGFPVDPPSNPAWPEDVPAEKP